MSRHNLRNEQIIKFQFQGQSVNNVYGEMVAIIYWNIF